MPTEFYTVPNQRVVEIHREKAKSDFLGINNETWKTASRDLRPTALVLYLYLASNANGYRKALSPAAIQKEIGMPHSTYHDQFKYLIEKGYLVQTGKNRYDFYEKSQNHTVPPIEQSTAQYVVTDDGFDFDNAPFLGMPEPLNEQDIMAMDIEINNSEERTDNQAINIMDSYWNGFCFEEIPREGNSKKDIYKVRTSDKTEFIF